MWQELVDKKDQWVGGKLKDFGDTIDRALVKPELIGMETTIVDFRLTDKWFEVIGEDFNCGGSRDHIGITGSPKFPIEGSGLAIAGYAGHEFHITMNRE